MLATFFLGPQPFGPPKMSLVLRPPVAWSAILRTGVVVVVEEGVLVVEEGVLVVEEMEEVDGLQDVRDSLLWVLFLFHLFSNSC